MKIALALLSLPIATAVASIDLTPVESVRILDGIKFQQLNFKENGRTITYERPRGWAYRFDAGKLVFTPADVSQAEAAIEQAPLSEPQTFDEETMKRLQEEALHSIPSGSHKVELVTVEKNPVLINRHETFEVTVTYQLGGVGFRRSVLFLNLPDTQIRFRVSAREGDFDKVHRAFRGSAFSWQWQ